MLVLAIVLPNGVGLPSSFVILLVDVGGGMTDMANMGCTPTTCSPTYLFQLLFTTLLRREWPGHPATIRLIANDSPQATRPRPLFTSPVLLTRRMHCPFDFLPPSRFLSLDISTNNGVIWVIAPKIYITAKSSSFEFVSSETWITYLALNRPLGSLWFYCLFHLVLWCYFGCAVVLIVQCPKVGPLGECSRARGRQVRGQWRLKRD